MWRAPYFSPRTSQFDLKSLGRGFEPDRSSCLDARACDHLAVELTVKGPPSFPSPDLSSQHVCLGMR
ncbi:protein of unknown function [Micropruina glycogenica]|uniref:Uncharacterized protein n=1 Tax=Micropruina glycogenica TaxID=75385 RepID=A0A2N9JCX0_9ACTN|nr:protein of unknown function [Micropruina glycogenica]